MKRARALLIASLALFLLGAIYATWWWNVGFWLQKVPEELTVSKILYQTNDSWGFGPGGNETGLVIYELPESAAKDIEEHGLRYFSGLVDTSGNAKNRYRKWEETPVPADGRWSGGEGATTVSPANRIRNHLNRYGFEVPINEDIEDSIDAAVTKPGSFFAYGRHGVLIVAPTQRRIFYAYNG